MWPELTLPWRMPLRVRVEVLTLASAVALLPSACGGNGHAAPMSAADFEDRFRDVVCQRHVACGWFEDRETCLGSMHWDESPVADVDAGKATFDGAAAAACLNAIGTTPSTCKYSVDPAGLAIPKCSNVFQGTLDLGASCGYSGQCASGSCDVGRCGGSCCQGTCVASTVRVALGDPCSPVGPPCIDGAFCRWISNASGEVGTCGPIVAEGQPCLLGDECATGSFLPGPATCL